MSPRRSGPVILGAIAAVALAAGLAPSVMRGIQQHRDQVAHREASLRLQQEQLAMRKYVTEHRAELIRKLRDLQAAGRHFEAMNEAAKYRLAADQELLQMYRTSAAIVSSEQMRASYRRLLENECTEVKARDLAADLIDGNHGAVRSVDRSSWKLTRLDAAAVLPAIQREIRARQAATAAAADGAAHEVESVESAQPRMHPYLISNLLSTDADASLVCAWHVAGNVRMNGQARRFVLDMWIAPAATGKTLEPGSLAWKILDPEKP